MAKRVNDKPLGIVAEIKASPIKKTSGRGWFDRLKEGEAKDDLRDLHRKKKAGEMEGYSHKIIREAILSKYGVDVGRHGLEGWFQRATPDG